MEAWSKFCSAPAAAGEVVPLRTPQQASKLDALGIGRPADKRGHRTAFPRPHPAGVYGGDMVKYQAPRSDDEIVAAAVRRVNIAIAEHIITLRSVKSLADPD